ncbi:hypothetical protein Athai_15330 [Actinocatenispora thailandica]|uniref:STAS domain-containing protein n=1 Tax=Actinocatenispora thailandica TaxID=227318 RepID=A0A7R7DLQ7_9ACTN|nr:STAS domain-containing protein [Actinocatenispora thailandica]BCJ34030.1 hypothetical protein Athai_15330 [Actinocatenispora thailandica]
MSGTFEGVEQLPPVRVRRTPRGLLIEWDGTVGAASRGPAHQLSDLWPHRTGEVVLLDLSGLHLVTADGIDGLLGAIAALARRGFDVRLCDPQPLVRTTLFLTGVPAGVAIYDDVPSAVAGRIRDQIDDRAYL